MSVEVVSRRAFAEQTLASLLAYTFLETAFRHDLFAAEVKPEAARWVADLNQLSLDLKGEKIEQTTWQKKVEELAGRVELGELLQLVDFDRVTSKPNFAARGERSLRFSFPKVDGLPTELCFGKQIFAIGKDRSVVPHGHNNMATAFIILKGKFHGRHYDRKQDEEKHLLIRPTLDRKFQAGECATISDYRDNVHWFTALDEPGFIFNFHVLDVRPGSKLTTGRVYVDPQGEKVAGGLIRARVIDFQEANRLYG